jgi:hypothetical protein
MALIFLINNPDFKFVNCKAAFIQMPLFLNKKTCRDVQVFFNDMFWGGRNANFTKAELPLQLTYDVIISTLQRCNI